MIVEAPKRTTASLVASCPRVLVCDPSEIARLGIAIALKPLGVEVVATTDGGDSLGVLDEQPVDLMLIDVNLPGSEQMIREAVERQVIVIGIGVEAGHERPFAALIAGAVGYLTKDLPASEWADGIKAAMRGVLPLPRPTSRASMRPR